MRSDEIDSPPHKPAIADRAFLEATDLPDWDRAFQRGLPLVFPAAFRVSHGQAFDGERGVKF